MKDNCKSAEGSFNAECSAEQFRRLRLVNAEAVLERWQACTAPLNNGAMSIPIADADITGREGHKVSDALQATVVTVLPKPAVSHHYRGDLSAVRPPPPALRRYGVVPGVLESGRCAITARSTQHIADWQAVHGGRGQACARARRSATAWEAERR